MKTLLDKAEQVLKVLTEDSKDTASILVAKFLEYSETDIKSFLGTEKPYSEILYDNDAKVAVACNKVSMFVTPCLFMKTKKNPAYPYKKVIPDAKKTKAIKLISDKELTSAIIDAKVKEMSSGEAQHINISQNAKNKILVSVDNAIKLLQFGTDSWKSEGVNKPLVKVKDGQTMLLMPSVRQ